jgi:hypothetical protein
MRPAIARSLALLAIVALPARATPIVTTAPCGKGTCATSILDLNVGGTAYDVTWSLSSYSDVLAKDAGVATFVGNAALAGAAAIAISAAFNSTGIPVLDVFKTSTGGWAATYIAQSINAAGTLTAQVAFSLNAPPVVTTAAATNDARPWAIFKPRTSVPEPGTLSLLAAGLLLAGLSRRRKTVP